MTMGLSRSVIKDFSGVCGEFCPVPELTRKIEMELRDFFPDAASEMAFRTVANCILMNGKCSKGIPAVHLNNAENEYSISCAHERASNLEHLIDAISGSQEAAYSLTTTFIEVDRIPDPLKAIATT